MSHRQQCKRLIDFLVLDLRDHTEAIDRDSIHLMILVAEVKSR